MQQRLQREVAGVVVYVLARVTFTLRVDNSVQRTQRRLRSRQFRLHSVVAQDVRELR
jgi:hypothetical protein